MYVFQWTKNIEIIEKYLLYDLIIRFSCRTCNEIEKKIEAQIRLNCLSLQFLTFVY